MKLLPPSQVKDLKAQELTREVLRIQEYQKAGEKARKEMANAEADFNTALAKHRNVWAGEEEEHEKRKIEMEREVKILEDRKTQALIPIQMYQDEATEMMKNAQEALQAAREREEDAEVLIDEVEDKLDELGEREQNLILAELKISSEKEGIRIQQENTSVRAKSIAEDMMAWAAQKTSEVKALRDRESEVIMRERSIIAKQEINKRTEEALQTWKKQLEDERGTLERIQTRLSLSKTK